MAAALAAPTAMAQRSPSANPKVEPGGGSMASTSYPSTAERPEGREEVSFARLLWVGPLTVVVALIVNLAIKAIVIALDPSLARMGQLGRSL
ncbi:MAG TPA: hypothetical protein VFX03_16950, partial [Thermomicrobiales bacterium]|nr:hypothetical protein [Thermomicrobiales bacterium]